MKAEPMWLELIAIFLFIFLIMLIQGNSSEINNEDFTYENEEELELLEDEVLFFMDEEEEDDY